MVENIKTIIIYILLIALAGSLAFFDLKLKKSEQKGWVKGYKYAINKLDLLIEKT